MIDERYHIVNERQNIFNGQNLVNGHYNSIFNEYDTPVNGTSINNHHTPYKINNGVAKSQIKIFNQQSELNNNLVNNKSEKRSNRLNHKQNDYPVKNHENNVDYKNDINRLANGKATNQKQLQKDIFNTTTNLRQLLRPTVIEKRQESAKTEYDTEDINGPYNFRQLLRPTEYLPTESLRKRKGGIVSNNGVLLPKDKIPEKHVKRRAPLAPTENKFGNAKK